MTTETGCRVSAEELKHDRDGEERQARINAKFVEMRQQYQNEITAGEIAEAISECSFESALDDLVAAYKDRDFAEMGIALSPIIGGWIYKKASKEVGRMIDRGDL